MRLTRPRRSLTSSHRRATASLPVSKVSSSHEPAPSNLTNQLNHEKQRALFSRIKSKKYFRSMPNTHPSKRVLMKYTLQWPLVRRSWPAASMLVQMTLRPNPQINNKAPRWPKLCLSRICSLLQHLSARKTKRTSKQKRSGARLQQRPYRDG